MTRPELAAKVEANHRSSTRVEVRQVIVLFGGIFIFGVGPAVFPKEPAWPHILGFIALLCFVLGYGVVLVRVTKRRIQQLGLICPHCDKPIVAIAGRIAVASGRCCYCGELLISDSDP